MASESRNDRVIGGAAARADQIGQTHHGRSDAERRGIESTGGWDAYEVWRRFFKEARERRQHGE
jgi:hypothetical protein